MQFQTGVNILLLFSLVTAPLSHAYNFTETPSGHETQWHHGQKFYLSGNPTNQSDITDTTIWKAIVNGLQQWSRVTQGVFDFDYWQGTKTSIFTADLKQDGLNSIFFASNSQYRTDPNIIGYTQTWFNATSGDILEADIVLNDINYQFTDNPQDTNTHRKFHRSARPLVYLNNVVTHELGHAIGLSHSSDLNSSMLFIEYLDQYKLGCDDIAAAKHLYQSPQTHQEGALLGTILSPSRQPVAGAVVTAISKHRGIAMASVHTNQSGVFVFGALEPGEYSLMVEKYRGTPESIPPNMRENETAKICEMNNFPTNFISDSTSRGLKTFTIVSRQQTSMGSFQLGCERTQNSETALNVDTPDIVIDSAHRENEERDLNEKTYRYQTNGPFQINVLTSVLRSNLQISISVFDALGNLIPTNTQSPLYVSQTSGFQINGASTKGTAFGPITVKVVTAENRFSNARQAPIWSGSTGLFMMVFDSNASSVSSSTIPNNAKCSTDEEFKPYQSPSLNPLRFATTQTTRQQLGFCGNAEAADFKKGVHPHSEHNQDLGTIIGWALPFLVAIGCQLFLRRRRAKL